MNPAIQMPEEGMTLDELSNFVAEQFKRLNLVLRNIDGLNIVDIKFELQGGAYIQLNRKGFVINNGDQNTFAVGIDGKATLTGVNVQTKDGAYPNITLDGDGDLLKASQSATSFIAIDPDATGSPTMIFQTPNSEGIITPINSISTLAFNATKGKLSINAQSDDLMLLSGNKLKLTCSDLVINGYLGFSGSFLVGTSKVTVENGIITDVT